MSPISFLVIGWVVPTAVVDVVAGEGVAGARDEVVLAADGAGDACIRTSPELAGLHGVSVTGGIFWSSSAKVKWAGPSSLSATSRLPPIPSTVLPLQF